MYYKRACSFGSLYKGLKRSCRNVRWKDSVTGYEANGLKNTLELSERLQNGKYRISDYQEFTVHEPKERRILASRLVDRQFQRSLCDNGLYDDIVEHLIRDNMACQTGRGVDDALKRMKVHHRRIRKLWEREKAGTVAPGATQESVRAFLANADRGNTWRIQQNMKQYYAECTGSEFK